VVPTTSPPRRRSKSKSGSTSQGGPLKGIRLSVTLVGAGGALKERLAAEKGLYVEEKGPDLTVAIVAASPEEALAQLRLLSGILARKA
jgi:hypothetical protein